MIIHLQDCTARPWKNGLGSTREIAARPAGASSDDFLWRASVAAVDTAAPFSCFPGVDRHIALLDGRGFTMTLDCGQVHALTTQFAPFAFSGEANVSVELAGGPTRDFNLMVRRSYAQSGLNVWRDEQTRLLDPTVVLVYCAAGQIHVAGSTLHTGDSWIAQGPPARACLQYGAVALVAHVVAL